MHTYIHCFLSPPPSPTSFTLRSLESTEPSSLWYTDTSCELSVLHMLMYICWCCSVKSCRTLLPHCVHKSILYIHISIPVLEIISSVPFFYIPYICTNVWCVFSSFCHTSFCMTESRFIHIITNDSISLFMAEHYSILAVHIVFFIHSSIGGHLGYLRVLAIVSSIAVNIGTCVFLELWFSDGLCPEVGLLSHVVLLCLIF